MTLEVSGSMN